MPSSWVRRLLRRRIPDVSRELIVNADDFGMSPSVTRGIIIAHEQGIVTSASLMVRRAAAAAAAAYARQRPQLSIGLHVDLGEWIRMNGNWEPLYIVADLADGPLVAREIHAQLDRFRDLVGCNPSHLDSHQHVHRSEPVLSAMQALAAEVQVPLRHVTARVRYCGDFYAQGRTGDEDLDAVGVGALRTLLAALPEGLTELCCHPGTEVEAGEQYGTARLRELMTLVDPSVRAAIVELGIRLRSFHGVDHQPAASTIARA